MDNFIGQVAGEMWSRLGDEGQVALSRVPDLVDQGPAIAYMALGWLARESKVSFYPSERGGRPIIGVGLTSLEQKVFESQDRSVSGVAT
jgi:hypothetical protein